jgi:hypothetical protein
MLSTLLLFLSRRGAQTLLTSLLPMRDLSLPSVLIIDDDPLFRL